MKTRFGMAIGMIFWAASCFAAGRLDDGRYAQPRDAFAAMDINGDGVLQPGEWSGRPHDFYRLDINQDSVLERPEFFGQAANPYESYTPDAYRPPSDVFFDHDINGDGVLSVQEWHGNRADFYNRDINRDGVLTQQEFYGRRYNAPRRNYDYQAMDSDGDGFVSLGEWRYDREAFDALDTDHNSELSSSELRTGNNPAAQNSNSEQPLQTLLEGLLQQR